jgi:hypothetical protein
MTASWYIASEHLEVNFGRPQLDMTVAEVCMKAHGKQGNLRIFSFPGDAIAVLFRLE